MDRHLGTAEFGQTGRIGLRRRGIVGQSDKRATHAQRTGSRRTEAERNHRGTAQVGQGSFRLRIGRRWIIASTAISASLLGEDGSAQESHADNNEKGDEEKRAAVYAQRVEHRGTPKLLEAIR